LKDRLEAKSTHDYFYVERSENNGLTNEEAVRKYRETGHEDYRTLVCERLVEKIKIYVWRHFRPLCVEVGFDEAIGIANLALTQAFNQYQDDRGAKFETFVKRKIRWGFLDYLKAKKRKVKLKPFSDVGADGDAIVDARFDFHPVMLNDLLGSIENERDRGIAFYLYRDCKSVKEIAEIFDVTKPAIYLRMPKLRKGLEEKLAFTKNL
jgi:DNA-directed RNA polymerase specialized sigma24 family protein